MVKNMKFSECLNFLLSISGISINRLSKAINVDSSLVNRWVNGKRIPPYNSNYISSISEYLSKNINNSFQIQHLDELFASVCEDSGIDVCVEDKLKKILSETQGYSIECRKMEMKKNKGRSSLNDCPSGFPYESKIKFENLTKCINHTHHTDLSSEDKIITGASDILSTVLFLLEAASSKKPDNDNTICISFISDYDLANQNHDGLIYIRNILLAAISKGWNILCLLRLNDNISRTTKFINFALPLMITGKFSLHYYISPKNFNTSNEVLIVPEVGTLVALPTNVNSKTDHAFFYKSIVAADIFCNYFDMLLATLAQPLFKYYALDGNIEYDDFLIESEECIGNRFTYKHNLCILLFPKKLYKKLLKRKKLSYSEMLQASEYYNRRVNAFMSNVNYYEYKDIYPIDSIINLIKYRRFYFYCYGRIEAMELTDQDIIDLLQNIISLLSTYANYNIALIPQNLDDIIEYADFSCILKERQALLLEVYVSSKSMPELRLSIEEPLAVKAFDDYFNGLWNQIAPENKDKERVINWMKLQIDSLKSRREPCL